MTLFLSRTLSGGWRMGFAAMLGASSGIVVHSLLAGFGLSALLAASVTAFFMLKIIGAGYLLFLAVQALRHGSVLRLAGGVAREQKIWQVWLAGLGINLTNPKIIMFFVTFLPQFVETQDPFAANKLLFLGLYFIVIALPCCAFMILVADKFILTVRNNPKALRWFDYGFAALMSGFALKLLTVQGK